jgi:hypothetical protein
MLQGVLNGQQFWDGTLYVKMRSTNVLLQSPELLLGCYYNLSPPPPLLLLPDIAVPLSGPVGVATPTRMIATKRLVQPVTGPAIRNILFQLLTLAGQQIHAAICYWAPVGAGAAHIPHSRRLRVRRLTEGSHMCGLILLRGSCGGPGAGTRQMGWSSVALLGRSSGC